MYMHGYLPFLFSLLPYCSHCILHLSSHNVILTHAHHMSPTTPHNQSTPHPSHTHTCKPSHTHTHTHTHSHTTLTHNPHTLTSTHLFHHLLTSVRREVQDIEACVSDRKTETTGTTVGPLDDHLADKRGRNRMTPTKMTCMQ